MDRGLRFVTLALAISLGLGIASAAVSGEPVLGMVLAGVAGAAGWPR